MEQVCARVEELRAVAQVELDRRQRVAQQALRRRDMAAEKPDILFHFQPGELVWMRAKGWAAGGKLKPKAVGPFRVLRVRGQLGQRVEVEQLPVEGQRKRRRPEPREVHAAQLAPYLGTYEEPELVYEDDPVDPALEVGIGGGGDGSPGAAGAAPPTQRRRRGGAGGPPGDAAPAPAAGLPSAPLALHHGDPEGGTAAGRSGGGARGQ